MEPKRRSVPFASSDDGPQLDRRLDRRRPGDGVLVCRLDRHGGGTVHGRLIDVSSAGAGAILPRDLDVGARVRLELRPIGPGEALAVTAVVRHARHCEDYGWFVGFQFDERIPAQRLAHLVEP